MSQIPSIHYRQATGSCAALRRSLSSKSVAPASASLLATFATVAPAEPAGIAEGVGVGTALLLSLLTALLIGAIIIIGLVVWGRRQEHVRDMILFCMKYLIDSEDEVERGASARALGRSNDPGALLVLANLIWDDEETETVRNAASEALHEMYGRSRRFRRVIAELETEAERKDYLRIIEILNANFEQGDKRYVQSAYIIGRHYMRLGRYADARDWLTKAEYRNRRFNLYGERIQNWIQVCNVRLLEEADDLYRAAEYQQAREHYAVLAHGLTDPDRQRWAIYLRSACVYCKLKEYKLADEMLLQALEHKHDTDLGLSLLHLLQETFGLAGDGAAVDEKRRSLEEAIDQRADAILKALLAKTPA